MKGNKLLIGVLFFGVIPFSWGFPQAGDYKVQVSHGPFAKTVSLSDMQLHHSDKWKSIMQRELVKPVNFAGHYRLYLSRNGELPKECGDDRWVCGWIIDKTTGKVVSELPEFNGNTAYYSYHANGTPVPEDFAPDFYPDSTMLWMNGATTPRSNPDAPEKCNYISYNFTRNTFTMLEVGDKCDVDHGDEPESDYENE